jgi:hypothetical protein
MRRLTTVAQTPPPSRGKRGTKVRIHDYNPIELGNAYDFFDERDRWQLYSKELQIKQEVLQRTMKQTKDLSDELKTRGKEVLSLRKDVKVLQQDNSRKHQALREEEMIERAAQDPERVQATQAMTVPELKTRLLKLAQAYKAARVRNSEFEEQIKQAYKDVEAIPKLQRELDRVQLEHKQRSQQLLEMQEETQQEGIYH